MIGWSLPAEAISAALPAAVSALAGGSILPAAEGIVTTDLYPKVRRAALDGGSIVGIAKGAGMIEPNLATMLVYILTDFAVPRDDLRAFLSEAVQDSFNAISVDSDTSTSDTVVLVSSGRVPCRSLPEFAAGLRTVCADLAEDVVRNGRARAHLPHDVLRQVGAHRPQGGGELREAAAGDPARGDEDDGIQRLSVAVDTDGVERILHSLRQGDFRSSRGTARSVRM